MELKLRSKVLEKNWEKRVPPPFFLHLKQLDGTDTGSNSIGNGLI